VVGTLEAISKKSFGLRLRRIGASFKILEILEYACGFKFGPAANLNQNLFFEMASDNLAMKKGASRPESALEAKSYICLDRKSIIGIFEIWL